MSIYLFHQQIIYFVILYSNGRINPYLNALLNFIVCSLLSLALSSALYQLKITRFLIGENNDLSWSENSSIQRWFSYEKRTITSRSIRTIRNT